MVFATNVLTDIISVIDDVKEQVEAAIYAGLAGLARVIRTIATIAVYILSTARSLKVFRKPGRSTAES